MAEGTVKPPKPDLSNIIKGSGGKIKVIVGGQLRYTCDNPRVVIERRG